MSLHIVIGYNGPRNTATPELVYLGRSGTAGAEARDASTCEHFDVFANPVGYRKNNPHCQANRAALDPAAQEAARVAEEQRQLEASAEGERLKKHAKAKAKAKVAAGAVASVATAAVTKALTDVIQREAPADESLPPAPDPEAASHFTG